MASFGTGGVPLLSLLLPTRAATPDTAIRGLFQEAHEIGAKALLALIGLHAGAALFHGLVLRDGVLQRMLPSSRAARAGRRMLVGKHKVIS